MPETIVCKAAVAWGVGQPITVETIQVGPPREDEIRIKIYGTSLCHSDIHKLDGNLNPESPFPIVLGHEAAGIVESVGAKVSTMKTGDHVIPVFAPECGACEGCEEEEAACSAGFAGLKGIRPDGTSPFTTKDGKTISLFASIGTFSEYTVCKENQVAKIDPKADLNKVGLIGCGVSTGYGASLNSAKVKKGKVVVIFGLGAIGLSAVMGAKKAGAGKIIAVDTNPDKFALAKEIGATDTINPKDHDKPIEAVVKQVAGNPMGVDFAIECIGVPAVQVAAFNCTKPACGVTTLVGISPVDKEISINPFPIVTGRKLVGSWFGGWKARHAIPKLVDEHLNGNLNFDKLITHRMPLEQINEAVTLLKESKCIRVMFDLH